MGGEAKFWVIDLPEAEAKLLLSDDGPLAGKPGMGWVDERGQVVINEMARRTLWGLLPFTDFRISRDDDGQRMEIGEDRRDHYPVLPAPEGTRPPA